MTDELRDGRVYRLDLGNVSAYLVDDGTVTLIDAGMPNAVETLRGELAEAGYDEGDFDRVLITHFDIDHVGTLADLDFDGPNLPREAARANLHYRGQTWPSVALAAMYARRLHT